MTLSEAADFNNRLSSMLAKLEVHMVGGNKYLGGLAEVINARSAGGSSSNLKFSCSFEIPKETARLSGLDIFTEYSALGFGIGNPPGAIHFRLLILSCDCNITTSVVFRKERLGLCRRVSYVTSNPRF